VESEVCDRGDGAGRVGERGARGEERLVGRSAARAAVGVAEAVAKERGTDGREILHDGPASV
jgi:DNA helicase TIP49 (TBP-interacting protein)